MRYDFLVYWMGADGNLKDERTSDIEDLAALLRKLQIEGVHHSSIQIKLMHN